MFANKTCLCLDGTIGVCETRLIPIHGGRYKLTVGVKKTYVPDKAWYRIGGLTGIQSHLSGHVQYDIEDKATNFHEITGSHLSAPEGAIIYLGNIKGGKVSLLDEHLKAKVDYLESVVSKLKGIYEIAKAQSNVESKEGQANLEEAMRKLGVIIRQVDVSRNQAPMSQPMHNPNAPINRYG